MSGPLKREERREHTENEEEEVDTLEWEMEEELEVGARMDCEPPKDPESRWQYPRPPRGQERRKLMGKVLEVAIKATFKNHIYLYRNELYRQKAGGAIGLRLTGIVARIVMDRWARVFSITLKEAEIILHMLRKYVDDVNLVLATIPRGYR